MINDLIKKLRKAADSLDDLLDSNTNLNTQAARLIGNKIQKRLGRPIGSLNKKKKDKKKHWTQTAEGKKKMSKIQKKAWVTRSLVVKD